MNGIALHEEAMNNTTMTVRANPMNKSALFKTFLLSLCMIRTRGEAWLILAQFPTDT